jgi:2-oxoglutarate ferredoxin oxidoreductase subunit alpha
MVFGASAAGARAMTSSSSPGISLKQEGISYIAGAELPSVIVNIMRGGPGLGNIMTAQSDYFQATRSGGHGDYHLIVLAPACVQEAFDLMFTGFDLADKYRTPVMILGDGILGQMMEPLDLSRKQKIKNYPKPWALTGCSGRKPNVAHSFYLKEGELEKFNLKLQKKYDTIRKAEQRAETLFLDDARIVLVAYGTMARIAKNIVYDLRKKGKRVGLIRPVTLWPFPEKILKGAQSKNKKVKFLTIEMSYGQMLEDVKLSLDGKSEIGFIGRSGGGIPTEKEIAKKIDSL